MAPASSPSRLQSTATADVDARHATRLGRAPVRATAGLPGLGCTRRAPAGSTSSYPRRAPCPTASSTSRPAGSSSAVRRDGAARLPYTVPPHEVTTGAYLIAKHEMTYADWIAWLRTIAALSRRGGARQHRASRGRDRAALLRWRRGDSAAADDPALRREPATRSSTPTASRAALDWRRLPGRRSRSRTRAYTEWLRRTVVCEARGCAPSTSGSARRAARTSASSRMVIG